MSLTSMVKTFGPPDVTVVGWKEEKKPPARGWQGSAKEDWVTE